MIAIDEYPTRTTLCACQFVVRLLEAVVAVMPPMQLAIDFEGLPPTSAPRALSQWDKPPVLDSGSGMLGTLGQISRQTIVAMAVGSGYPKFHRVDGQQRESGVGGYWGGMRTVACASSVLDKIGEQCRSRAEERSRVFVAPVNRDKGDQAKQRSTLAACSWTKLLLMSLGRHPALLIGALHAVVNFASFDDQGLIRPLPVYPPVTATPWHLLPSHGPGTGRSTVLHGHA